MVDQNPDGVPPSDHGQDTRDSELPVVPVAKARLMRSRRQMYLQIVAAMVILACGIVIGSGAALLHFKPNIVPDRVPLPGDIVRDMRARYDLTEEQAEKVKTAVKDSSERMRTIFTGIRETMDAEFKQFSSEIKLILTPEQFKKWEFDFKSRRARRPGRFGPGRPGPGGPGPGGPGPGGPGPGGPGSGRHRPPGWPGGPGGGRSGFNRMDPNGMRDFGWPDPNGRRPYPEFRPKPLGPAEPNSPVEQ